MLSSAPLLLLHSHPILQDIMAHPWFAEGLNPAVAGFNDGMVQQSLQSQAPQAVLDQVRPWCRSHTLACRTADMMCQRGMSVPACLGACTAHTTGTHALPLQPPD